MKNIIYLCILSILIATNACSRSGFGTETVGPSLRSYNFGAEGGSVTITTRGTFWWISEWDFRTYGSTTFVEFTRGRLPSGIRIEEVVKVKSDWFEVTKETARKLRIEVQSNETGEQRLFRILLDQGNVGVFVTITQAAK